MKVIAINGSARKDGNTAVLLNTVLAVLQAAGIETEFIQLAGETVSPCKACWACGGKGNCVHGQMPGDVAKDEEGLVNMKNLGQNMAYLLAALKQKAGD